MFVHTDIVILAKFVTTLVEKPGYLKSHFFMKVFGTWVG
jgi:hypothetical protein